MEYRKYLVVFIFMAAINVSKAQVVKTFEQADSTSNALSQSADWKQLIDFGQLSINAGFDFPALRQRLGNAYMMEQNYSAALAEYDMVFKNDSYNQTARYYAYLCRKYLNQDQGASYNASYVDTTVLKNKDITPYGLLTGGLETGLKYPGDKYRGTASYTRVSLSNRLSWRWQLEQSLAYFNQSVTDNVVQIPGAPRVSTDYADQQFEYYGKLSFSMNENVQLIGVYHYLHANYQNVGYSNNIGLAGIKYTGSYVDIQADVNMGNITGQHLNQYNATLMLYPMGNLNFYLVSRGSYHDQNGGNGVFEQSVGYKLFKNTWAQTSATFGSQDNYVDADGLYIYNAIDATTLRVGQTIFYQLNNHAQLQLNYTYEKKKDDNHNLNYNQNSITAGLLWKF